MAKLLTYFKKNNIEIKYILYAAPFCEKCCTCTAFRLPLSKIYTIPWLFDSGKFSRGTKCMTVVFPCGSCKAENETQNQIFQKILFSAIIFSFLIYIPSTETFHILLAIRVMLMLIVLYGDFVAVVKY